MLMISSTLRTLYQYTVNDHTKKRRSILRCSWVTSYHSNLPIFVFSLWSGVANAGIDCSEIYTAMRIEIPPSIMDICQEKGRVGRVPSPSPEVYSYMICFDIDSFILLLKRTLNPEQKMSTEYRRSMIDDHIAVAELFCSVNCCFNEVFETALLAIRR